MKKEALLQNVQKALVELDQRLSHNRFTNQEGETYTSRAQLTHIRGELTELEAALIANKLDQVGSKELAMGRIVTDTWDLNDHLGTQLCAIADTFRRLLRQQ